MRKNAMQPERTQCANTIWRMRFSFWITKATNPHSEYVILISFPQQQWLHERASLLRYTYIAYVFIYFFQLCYVFQPTPFLLDIFMKTEGVCVRVCVRVIVSMMLSML